MLRRTFLVWAVSQGTVGTRPFEPRRSEMGRDSRVGSEATAGATTLGNFARQQWDGRAAAFEPQDELSISEHERQASPYGHRFRQDGEDFSSSEKPLSSSVSASDTQYAKTGYDFVEHFRVIGPRAALSGIQWNLLVYTVVGATVILYCVYYITSFKFTLTTDPAPQRNTMFQRFPSDYAVVVNRWTGHRRTIQVQPAPEERRHPDGTLPYNERIIRVNRLKDKLIVYHQRTTATILVDTAPLLDPDRFVALKNQSDRSSVAIRRTDQLLPEGTLPPMKNGKHEEARALQKTPIDGKRHRFVVETEMRMRDIRNGDAQGNILAFRETVEHVINETLTQRLYDALLTRTMSGGMKQVYAEEMIKNGAVTAQGIQLTDLVPDIAVFGVAVFDAVRKRMGEDVLLYKYRITLT